MSVTGNNGDTNIANKSLGKYVFTINATGSSNIVAELKSDTKIKPQFLIFNALNPITYVTEMVMPKNISLSASSTSNLPVSFSSSNPSIADIDNIDFSKLNIYSAGNVVITANQFGGSGYYPAYSITQSLTIFKGQQSILGTSYSSAFIYDNPYITLNNYSIDTTSKLTINDLNISYTISNTQIATLNNNVVNFKKPGSIYITASQVGDSRYNNALDYPINIDIIDSKPTINNITPNVIVNQIIGGGPTVDDVTLTADWNLPPYYDGTYNKYYYTYKVTANTAVISNNPITIYFNYYYDLSNNNDFMYSDSGTLSITIPSYSETIDSFSITYVSDFGDYIPSNYSIEVTNIVITPNTTISYTSNLLANISFNQTNFDKIIFYYGTSSNNFTNSVTYSAINSTYSLNLSCTQSWYIKSNLLFTNGNYGGDSNTINYLYSTLYIYAGDYTTFNTNTYTNTSSTISGGISPYTISWSLDYAPAGSIPIIVNGNTLNPIFNNMTKIGNYGFIMHVVDSLGNELISNLVIKRV